MTDPPLYRQLDAQDFEMFQEAFNTGRPEIIVDILWERAQERARQKAARAAGTNVCFKCVNDYGPHPWHDNGTRGPGREAWERGGRFAPPERVD